MRQKLRHEMTNQQLILNDVNYRAEWGRYQERIRKQEQEKQEKVILPYCVDPPSKTYRLGTCRLR